jgi:hypothetical protein
MPKRVKHWFSHPRFAAKTVHIHQTQFLVTEVNGVLQEEDSLRDTPFSLLRRRGSTSWLEALAGVIA